MEAGGKPEMEVICFSETSVDFQWTTRLHIQEDNAVHKHRWENLKPYNIQTARYL
jgi:hypothetical protein